MSAQGKRDHTHWLYIGVIVAVILGVAFGLLFPDQGQSLKILGTMFVGLVKMMIAPIIFCTIVLGIGHVREAATVGRAGGIALVYFIVMSTFALAVGLVVGNIIKPGTGLDISGDGSRARALVDSGAAESQGLAGFISSIIPETMISSLTSGKILQTLFIALLVGVALQSMPE